MKPLWLLTILAVAVFPWLGTCNTANAAAKPAAAEGAAKKPPAIQMAPGPHGRATIVSIRKGLPEGVPPPPPADPVRVAAARPLVQVLGLREKAIDSLNRFIPRMTEGMRYRIPELTDAEMKKVPDRLRANAYATLGRLLEYQAHVFAQHYTVDQLKAITAFYRSDAGKRMLSEGSKIDLEMGPVKGGWTFGYLAATNKEMGGPPLKTGMVVSVAPNAKPGGGAANRVDTTGRATRTGAMKSGTLPQLPNR